MTGSPGKRRIILVHGTWGRGFFPSPIETSTDSQNDVPEEDEKARWFEPASSFRSKLASWLRQYGFTAQIEVFEWSGANSVFERDAAAKRLRDFLAASEDETTIIAHSHGGNVAMRAIHLLDEANRKIELITMGTPFLNMFPTHSRIPEFLASIALLLIMFSWFIAPLSLMTDSEPIGLLVSGLLGLILINVWQYGIVNGGGVHTFWPLWRSWQGRPWHLLLANDSSNAVERTRLLVIRTIEDEPGLILAAAVMGNRLSNAFQEISASKFAWGFSALVALGGIMAHALGFSATAKASYFVLTVGAISLFALPILAGLFKSAFGREFVVGSSRVLVVADSVPDHSDPTVVTLNTGGFSALRHSVHGADLASLVIVQWISHKKIPDHLVKLIKRSNDSRDEPLPRLPRT
jgi:hypothetical protein